MKELDQIRVRLEAATPGPWEVHRGGDFQSIKLHRGTLWIDVVDGSHQTPPHGEWIDSPDIDFLEHAPADIARLLAAVEAVERVVGELASESSASMNVAREIGKAPITSITRQEIRDHEQAATIATNHAARIRAALAEALGGDQ